MYPLKKRLTQGETVIGTFVSEVRNPNLAYILAQGGLDFMILDNEHGAYSTESVSAMVAAARGAGLSVVVRVPQISREAILKPLDSGAEGLLVPMVDSADQAGEVIAHAKYPPQGKRGVGLRRAHSLYHRVSAAEYLEQANQDTFIAVQAETPEAVAAADDIASLPGIDCLFVGPMDLSVNLGIPGQTTHPREIEAIETVVQACQSRSLAAGVWAVDPDAARHWINKGVRFLAYSSDVSLLADGAAAALAQIKQ
ncbi:MAG: aldolase/citrate lyase family protein [Desulfarculaceae bacterium]|jgi:2-keto-3-deoxy-L-rhamnonate aldolase RhmA